tara:strand:+ start:421 stop:1209 length:789 start_codon:yes stop_codon:yes gene_type:complete
MMEMLCTVDKTTGVVAPSNRTILASAALLCLIQFIVMTRMFSRPYTYSPRFYFSPSTKPETKEWFTNETLRIMHSNGLRVRNLDVYNTLDEITKYTEMLKGRTDYSQIMGYWRKLLPVDVTNIRLSKDLHTRPAILFVLAHELAHEYHYQCQNSWLYLFKSMWTHVTNEPKERALEMYTNRLGMFMLARTCVYDPQTMMQGFLYINGPAHQSREYRRLAADLPAARAYAARACTQGRAALTPTFDVALCPGRGVLSVNDTVA